MKRFLAIACTFISIHSFSQKQDPSGFFPKNELMTIGTYYYPEHWPQSHWAKDIKKMAEIGFEFTHLGEFAWAFIEPEEGKFDFAWMYEVVALAHQNELLDAKLVERWKEYVQNGGHLILSSHTGQKDRNAKLWEMKWAQPIYDLIGAKIVFYDLLPENVVGKIKSGTHIYDWNNWADVLEPLPGTEVWATYDNQFYAGKAAVTSRKLGKGTVTHVGPDTDDGLLEKAVLAQVYKQAGIQIENYPKGVMFDWRDGFWVGVNYSDDPYAVTIPAAGKMLIGNKVLKPASVIVWKEK